MNRLLCLFAFTVVSAFAQAQYIVSYEAAFVAGKAMITIQQPASNASPVVRFVRALVYCANDCHITVERSGTPATTTLVTPVAVNANVHPPRTQAFVNSNVGPGTVILTVTPPKEETTPYLLDRFSLSGSGKEKNLTFRVTGGSNGTIRIAVEFLEQ